MISARANFLEVGRDRWARREKAITSTRPHRPHQFAVATGLHACGPIDWVVTEVVVGLRTDASTRPQPVAGAETGDHLT